MIQIYSKNTLNGENEIQICPMPLIIKLQDQQRYEFVSSLTFVIDVFDVTKRDRFMFMAVKQGYIILSKNPLIDV